MAVINLQPIDPDLLEVGQQVRIFARFGNGEIALDASGIVVYYTHGQEATVNVTAVNVRGSLKGELITTGPKQVPVDLLYTAS